MRAPMSVCPHRLPAQSRSHTCLSAVLDRLRYHQYCWGQSTLSNNSINQTQVHGLLGAHEVVPVRLLLHLLQALPRELHIELVDDLASTKTHRHRYILKDGRTVTDCSYFWHTGESSHEVTFMVRFSSDAWMLTSSAEPIAPPQSASPLRPPPAEEVPSVTQPHRHQFPPRLAFFAPPLHFRA
jgi:hypothetical protein